MLSGTYTGNGEMVIHMRDSDGAYHLSFTTTESGAWQTCYNSSPGQYEIHFTPSRAEIQPSNDYAHNIVEQDPAKFRGVEADALDPYFYLVLSYSENELRALDPETGIEIIDRRRK